MGSTTVKEWNIVVLPMNRFLHSVEGQILPGTIFSGVLITTSDNKSAKVIKGTTDHVEGFVAGLKCVFGIQFMPVQKH